MTSQGEPEGVPGRSDAAVCHISARPSAMSAEVSDRMRRQRSEDTKPEVELRRRLYAMGLRYRVHRPVLTGVRRRHDIVFGPSRTIVEFFGCWWHGCGEHFRPPATNRDWWQAKVNANRARDEDTRRRLEADGWHLEIVWEHEDLGQAAERVAEVVRSRRPQ